MKSIGKKLFDLGYTSRTNKPISATSIKGTLTKVVNKGSTNMIAIVL